MRYARSNAVTESKFCPGCHSVGAVITTADRGTQCVAQQFGEAPMLDGIDYTPAAGKPVSHDVVTIPNMLTFSRICAVPLAIWLVLKGDCEGAVFLFVLAGLTDALDGWLARRQGVSTLGALLDPLADKLLLTSMFITLAAVRILPIWLAILVVFRDVLIIGGILLLRLLNSPVVIRPLLISKLNTAAQIALVALALAGAGFGFQAPVVRIGLIFAVSLTTFISGAAYVTQGAKLA
jgi:cardiolipin synthase